MGAYDFNVLGLNNFFQKNLLANNLGLSLGPDGKWSTPSLESTGATPDGRLNYWGDKLLNYYDNKLKLNTPTFELPLGKQLFGVDYALLFRDRILPQMDLINLRTGLMLLGSTDPNALILGRNMVLDSIPTNPTQNQPTGLAVLPDVSNLTGENINYGQQFLNVGTLLGSLLASSLGGLAGLVASKAIGAAGSVTNSISNLRALNAASNAGVLGLGKAKAGNAMAIAGAVSDLATSFLPEKTEYNGPKGDITRTMDSVYDGISDAAMSFGPVGCVCAGTRVVDKLGRFVNIENLKKDDGIVGWGNKQAQIQNIYSFKDPDYKNCIEIELQSGTILLCSTDHPILFAPKGRAERITINGERKRVKSWIFKPAGELLIGDNIGIVNDIDIWGTEDMWEPYLIGLLIGDGTYGKDHGVRIFSGDSDTWNYIEKYDLGGKINFDDSEYLKEFRAYRIYDGSKHLRNLGIYEQTKENKKLPENIYKYNKESICKLIAGLIDTDGCVQANDNTKEYKIIFYLSNEILINLVRELLLKLGIHCSLLKTKEKNSNIRNREIISKPGFKLVIKDKLSLLIFCENISLNISYKQNTLNKIYEHCLRGFTNDNRYLSGAKSDKVVRVTNIGLKLVYNLLADDDHTYIANGIITHNTLVGGIMKGGKLLGGVMNSVGGGTDGMTTTDAILGSSFLNLTPIGLINGFGGLKALTITKDEQAFETVGASYTGSNLSINSALQKSGKKYGLFSSSAREKANEEILEARRLQAIITDIADETTDRFAIRNSMSAINGNRRALAMRGGYNQAAIRAGRHGMIILAKRIVSQYNLSKRKEKFQKGGTLEDSFIIYLNSLPEYQRDSTDYRVKDYWEFNGRPKNFGEAIAKGMFTFQDDGWHANSVLENPNTGEIEFMKSDKHPSHQKEVDWYYSDDGADFRSKYELIKSSPYWKYVKRKEVQEYKEGGSFNVINSMLLAVEPDAVELFKEGGTIETTSFIVAVEPEDEIQEYKEGGSFNVIPEGALHARLHHMENADNLTKKGIPVVVEKDGGELEQLAEIEREEIIFRLEVTKKLEELAKDGSDEAAVEAGKLLVEEILNNTIDNTNRLL